MNFRIKIEKCKFSMLENGYIFHVKDSLNDFYVGNSCFCYRCDPGFEIIKKYIEDSILKAINIGMGYMRKKLTT